jgi:quercetin dioxygenase-like cupin family protein
MTGRPEAGIAQRVLVRLDPHARIPLHTHSVDATMHIVEGYGELLSDDELNGRAVAIGDCVFFERNGAHGFRAGGKGLAFVSENDGIVDAHSSEAWDLRFS